MGILRQQRGFRLELVDIRPGARDQPLPDGERLLIARQSRLRITDGGPADVPLQLGNSLVSHSHLTHQVAISRGLLTQLVEVLQRALDDEMPCRTRT